MIKFFLSLLLLAFLFPARGQAQSASPRPDSISFHLYTDSLKKGIHNYINVDAKYRNGHWLPLSAKELSFSATAGKFDGNNLIIDTAFKGEKVTIRAVLKSDTAMWKEITIYLKKWEPNERLKTMEEVMQGNDRPRKKRKG